jgi:hypothetical protein
VARAEPWTRSQREQEHDRTEQLLAENAEIIALLEQAARRLRHMTDLYREREKGTRRDRAH